MVKIQCGACQMILSLPDNNPQALYVCEYCKALIKAPVDTFGTGIAMRDFTILKKSMPSCNETDIFIAHQISLDRPVFLGLHTKNSSLDYSAFFKASQAFACLNHKSISTIFDIGKEENIIFRSYEYNDGNFITDLCQRKIPLKIAVNIFLDYMNFAFYFIRTKTGKCYKLLPNRAIITPEHQIKIIPSGLEFYTNPKCNTRIFKSITDLFLNMITDFDCYKENSSFQPLSEKLNEFVLANMNMTNNMFFNIINGKEKNYFLLYDKVREEMCD